LIFFLVFGLGLAALGSGLGLYLIYSRIAVGPVAPVGAVFAALAVIIGVQSLLFALWMDMERNRDLK
jgi:hypothetical protein